MGSKKGASKPTTTKDLGKTPVEAEIACPMNPYKKWGHVCFWGGVGLAAFGGVSSRAWTGMMYAGFAVGGASLITGLVLWALSPGDKEWFESHAASVSVEPGGSGVNLSLGWRW